MEAFLAITDRQKNASSNAAPLFDFFNDNTILSLMLHDMFFNRIKGFRSPVKFNNCIILEQFKEDISHSFNLRTIYMKRYIKDYSDWYQFIRMVFFAFGLTSCRAFEESLMKNREVIEQKAPNAIKFPKAKRERKKLTKLQKEGKRYISEHGKGREKVGSDMNLSRTIVVRSKNGDGPVLFFDGFEGRISKETMPQLNAIKAAYHYQTGISYYDARPVLYSSWIEYPEWRKNSSVRVYNIDNEFNDIDLMDA